MRQLILIIILFAQSCISTNAQSKDDYRKIVDDIKNSKEYKDFVNKREQGCKTLLVSKYKYSICSFGSFFKNGDIKTFIDNECSEKETFKSKKCNRLKKLSDKGETCFIADFSFKVKDKIAVKIISKNDERKIGYESLHFLYDLADNQVKRLESIEVIND
jgi:hypothetical protein